MNRAAKKRLRAFESLETRRLLDGQGLADIEAADLDGNGVVNFADFLKLSRNFGRKVGGKAEGDVDGDGVVGFPDFLRMAQTFGMERKAETKEPARRPVEHDAWW